MSGAPAHASKRSDAEAPRSSPRSSPRTTLPPSAPAAHPRVLITRPDHLGDVLLSLPAAAALRRALPDASIAYLVRPEVREVLTRVRGVDEVLTAPFPPPTADAAGLDDETLRTHAGRLRGRFDVALVLRPTDPWSAPIVARAEIPVRVGFDWPATRPHLTSVLPDDPRRAVAQLGLELAGVAADVWGAKLEEPAFDDIRLETTPADETEVSSQLASRGLATAPFVLHPGSGWPLKNWAVARWGRVAAGISSRYGVRPVVTGGPGEEEAGRAVVEASRGAAVSLAGSLSLGALAALCRRAEAVVATDSGPLHLAAMVGARAVGIYGPADPAVFAPWCPPAHVRAVWAKLPCSPCGTLSGPPCGAVSEPACIDQVSVADVLGALDEVLTHSCGRRPCGR